MEQEKKEAVKNANVALLKEVFEVFTKFELSSVSNFDIMFIMNSLFTVYFTIKMKYLCN